MKSGNKNSLQEFLALKKEVEHLKSELDKGSGSIRTLRKRLKDEHQLEKMKDARDKLANLSCDLMELDEQVIRALKQFRDQFDKALEEASR
jgi:predicted component of type VI protein secretion system